jgi:hypothetical protein
MVDKSSESGIIESCSVDKGRKKWNVLNVKDGIGSQVLAILIQKDKM